MSDLQIIIPETDEQALASLTKVGDYLPYVSLYATSAGAVLEGKIAAGNFGLVVNQVILDLKREFNCHVIMYRPKAMIIGDSILSYYDMNSPEFKAAKATADLPGMNNALAGLEFLIFLPDVGDDGTFATFFAANKSARKESANIRTFRGGKFTTWTSILHKGPKFSWFVPKVVACSTSSAVTPDPDELTAQIAKFASPKSSTVEAADPAAQQRAR